MLGLSSADELSDCVTQCRGCLGALQRGEAVFPRSEIVDHCVALLLAAGECEFLLGLDGRWNSNVNVELASNLAAICFDLQRNRDRPNRKIPRSLWDLIVPVFNPASGSAAANQGQTSSSAKRSTAFGLFDHSNGKGMKRAYRLVRRSAGGALQSGGGGGGGGGGVATSGKDNGSC